MTRYTAIHHIALVTADMDKTVRFWRDLLGIELAGGMANNEVKQYFFAINDSCLVSFFQWPDVQPIQEKDAGRPVAGNIAFDHICLEVSDDNELWALKDKLDAADIWVSEVIDNGFIHSIFTFDPNGIAVEVCRRVKGVDMALVMGMIDPLPSPVVKEGVGPQPFWPETASPTQPDNRRVYPGELRRFLKQ
ncbi:glyoxalase/bleomycin resistance protein/dioxygenase [Candidatus Magnetobacterium bavaricum]|uniref:Glyoxalase/bleomycin resistance protein/dioxygenase n=1 Tax=Candidatus Magnetobacterium bavaricum TaxID=29290 RepID=A0A0F3GTY1_9BACT|nr:glyoxalase/bleomycin resistance protein/dioxygenase [Candidatus Magnetobacterium bavaricum]